MKFLLGLMFFSQALFAVPSDSGITGPSYDEILANVGGLVTKYPTLIKSIDYGKSVEGRTLRLYVIGKQTGFSGTRNAILISGSTHGDEYLNIEDRLPAALLGETAHPDSAVAKYIEKGGVFLMIPILNPDGYSNRVRENAHGVDLNRDWTVKPANFEGFKEVETKNLAAMVDGLVRALKLKLVVSVDYHCCEGALLYPWSFDSPTPMPAVDLAAHRKIGQEAHDLLNVSFGTTNEILGYYAVGTTKDYYYVTYGTHAFTFEGRFGEENGYLDRHLQWWQTIVQGLAE